MANQSHDDDRSDPEALESQVGQAGSGRDHDDKGGSHSGHTGVHVPRAGQIGLRLEVNGRAFEEKLFQGGGDASIFEDPQCGREHGFSVPLASCPWTRGRWPTETGNAGEIGTILGPFSSAVVERGGGRDLSKFAANARLLRTTPPECFRGHARTVPAVGPKQIPAGLRCRCLAPKTARYYRAGTRRRRCF